MALYTWTRIAHTSKTIVQHCFKAAWREARERSLTAATTQQQTSPTLLHHYHSSGLQELLLPPQYYKEIGEVICSR